MGPAGARVSNVPSSQHQWGPLAICDVSRVLEVSYSLPGHKAPTPEEGARTEQAEAPCRGQACTAQKAQPVGACPGESSCHFIPPWAQAKGTGPSKLWSCYLMRQVMLQERQSRPFQPKLSPAPFCCGASVLKGNFTSVDGRSQTGWSPKRNTASPQMPSRNPASPSLFPPV